jgi:hypothetical protein
MTCVLQVYASGVLLVRQAVRLANGTGGVAPELQRQWLRIKRPG